MSHTPAAADSELDDILWNDLGIDLNAHPAVKSKLAARDRRLELEAAIKEQQYIIAHADDWAEMTSFGIEEASGQRIAELKANQPEGSEQ